MNKKVRLLLQIVILTGITTGKGSLAQIEFSNKDFCYTPGGGDNQSLTLMGGGDN